LHVWVKIVKSVIPGVAIHTLNWQLLGKMNIVNGGLRNFNPFFVLSPESRFQRETLECLQKIISHRGAENAEKRLFALIKPLLVPKRCNICKILAMSKGNL